MTGVESCLLYLLHEPVYCFTRNCLESTEKVVGASLHWTILNLPRHNYVQYQSLLINTVFAGHISSKAQDCQNNNNTGSTSSNLPTAPPAENDYAYIDEVTSSRPHSDVNPYEVAADGAPENVRTLSGNYSHIADLGTTKMAATKKKEGSTEGDYSQVDDNFYSVVKPVLNGVIVYHMVSLHRCCHLYQHSLLSLLLSLSPSSNAG